MEIKEAKVIFSPQLANYLLKNGYEIIKLKPKHDAENETVFVFSYDEDMDIVIEEWVKNKEEK